MCLLCCAQARLAADAQITIIALKFELKSWFFGYIRIS